MFPHQTCSPPTASKAWLQALAELASRSGLPDVKAMSLAFEAVRLVNAELAVLPDDKSRK
jgi:hypothetical protein